MAAAGWALADVHDVIADAVPDRDMLICGDVRRTYGEVRRRTRSLAAFLGARGIGLHRERDELERWESGQDAVALVLHNGPEYVEAMLGCFRARAVPFNVNQHYRPAEVGGAARRPARPGRSCTTGARARCSPRPTTPPTWCSIDVDDGSGVDAACRAAPASRRPRPRRSTGRCRSPSPDDLYLVCTGGTTGPPKAVLWRQADIFVLGHGRHRGRDGRVAGRPRRRRRRQALVRGAAAHARGRPVDRLLRPPLGRHRRAARRLASPSTPPPSSRLIERERVDLMSIVGDAYARPLVDELRRGTYDLSSLAHHRHRRRGDERAAARTPCSSCSRTS